MFYIIGRIADKKLLEITGRDAVDITSYKSAIVKNYGGVTSDYSILTIPDTSIEVERIKAGHEYTLVWAANEITGISFSDFDTKIHISFKADKTEILADGGESTTVEVALVDIDNTPVLETVRDVYIPVQASQDTCKKKVNIENGTTKFDFATTKAGTWKFPADGTIMINGYRVHNQVVIEALLV